MKRKIISNSVFLYESVLEIMPYALDFYGDKYKRIVDSAIKHSKILEWDSKTKKELINEATGKNIINDIKGGNGFYFYNEKMEEGYEHIIAVKKTQDFQEQKLVLAHELFGHAVLSERKTYVKENNNIYQRNGIAKVNYFNKNDVSNIMINEGLVEYIAEEIIKMYNPDYRYKIFSTKYCQLISIARILFDVIGKDKMLELLVLNKGNINELFNPDDLDEWNSLSKEIAKDDSHIEDYILRLIRRNN